jgi:hypothetical protein
MVVQEMKGSDKFKLNNAGIDMNAAFAIFFLADLN